jgi:hypothetical protein
MEQWPADKVERRKVADLIPYARNSRTHSEAQVAQIAASIREWGWTMPILVDETGNIIAGHGRVMAAQKLGINDVPCMTAEGWSEAKRRAYVIADNKLALNAGWDNEILRVEIEEIKELDFDLTLIGFDAAEITGLFLEQEDGETNAEEEWQGMPEFEDQDPCFRKVIVNFDTAADVQNFFDLLDQKDTGKTKSIWFPEKERRDLEAMRWAEDDEE